MEVAMSILWKISLAASLVAGFALSGCTGDAGLPGPLGPQGAVGKDGTNCTVTDNGDGTKTIACEDGTSVTVSNGQAVSGIAGTVTNSLTEDGLAGVTITLDPAVEGATLVTDATGGYRATVPLGYYAMTFKLQGYKDVKTTVSIIGDETKTVDAVMVPSAPVVVTVAATPASANPGGSATLSTTLTIFDGTAADSYSYSWAQVAGTTAGLSATNVANPVVTLPDAESYKAAIWNALLVPDRAVIAGISPFAIEEAGMSELEVTVTGNGATYKATITVNAKLPVGASTGLPNVPIDVPMMLHAKSTKTGSWTLDTKPAGSTAALDAAASRNPVFRPDQEGKYVLSYPTASGSDSISFYAGKWMGVITGVASDGAPLVDGCTLCHRPGSSFGPDFPQFNDWAHSGHAEIFAQNLDTVPGHYSTSCFACHTVGYDKNAVNGGVDEAGDFTAFLDRFGAYSAQTGEWAIHSEAGAWSETVSDYSSVAKLANIQCENCHGPQGTDLGAHKKVGSGPADAVRMSIDAGVCGSCHGEPPRHGRYQQWQESGHGNFALAEEEATIENRDPVDPANLPANGGSGSANAGHCGRCHSGQGFLDWIEHTNLTDCIGATGKCTSVCDGSASCGGVNELAPLKTYLTSLGLTQEKILPQTCVTCHDPHKQGKTSGEPNTSTVRISGSTKMLPSGWSAVAVGRGALCITCHNTRNGLKNDSIAVSTTSPFGAPHVAAQGDVLMGQNAYFVPINQRSRHADIVDTCANCHLEKTTPPADYSYAGGGTNHAFAAKPEICIQCHGEGFNELGLQEEVENALADIKALAQNEILERIKFFVNATAPSAVFAYIDIAAGTTGADFVENTDKFILNDGVNPAKTFEFDKDGVVASGNVAVSIKATSTAADIAKAIRTAISGAPAFFVRPYATTITEPATGLYLQVGTTVTLIQELATEPGNQSISETVATPNFTFGAWASGTGDENKFVATKPTYYDADGTETGSSSYDVVIGTSPTKIDLEEIHGQQGIKMTFAGAISVNFDKGYPTGVAAPGVKSVTELHIQLGNLRRNITHPSNPLADGSVFAGYVADGGKPPMFDETYILPRALWNYALVHADSSKGVHNPSWVFNILEATYNNLAAELCTQGTYRCSAAVRQQCQGTWTSIKNCNAGATTRCSSTLATPDCQ
jgi:hypothetical protein